MQAEQVLNWTVDGGQHSLDLPGLQGGLQYLVSLAALNGAGVGLSTEPYRLNIGERQAWKHNSIRLICLVS